MDNGSAISELPEVSGGGGGEEEEEPLHIFDRLHIRVILIILYSIVFFFCFFGNLTVVLVTNIHWRMRNVTKFCLCNLAFANLCVGIFCIYQNLSLYFFNGWIFGDFLCKMYHFTRSLSHTASIFILIVISVERYLVIIHPLKCRQILTIQRLRCTIVVVWTVSAMLALPNLFNMAVLKIDLMLFRSGEEELRKAPVYCVPLKSSTSLDFQTSDLIHFILLYLIPLLIIAGLYTKVAVFLRHRDRICRELNLLKRNFDSQNELDKVQTICSLSILCGCRRSAKDSKLHGEQDSISTVMDSPVQSFYIDTGTPRTRNGNLGSRPLTDWPHLVQISPTIMESSESRQFFRCRTKAKHMRRPHKTVIRMLLLVVLVFAICNLPFHLRKLYQNYAQHDPESDVAELLTPITYLMMYANCAINPFLYGYMSKDFRISCREFFQCKVTKLIPSVSSNTTRPSTVTGESPC